jgi:hypothetical protein
MLERDDIPTIERLLIGREIARITERKQVSRKTGPGTSTPPDTPAGGEDAERRAAERRTFLQRLASL